MVETQVIIGLGFNYQVQHRRMKVRVGMRLVWSFSRLLSRLSGTTSLPTLCTQHFSDRMSLALLKRTSKLPKDMTISFPTCASLAKHSRPKQRKKFLGINHSWGLFMIVL